MRKNLALIFAGLAAMACAGKAEPQPAPADPDVVLPPTWAFGVMYGGYTTQAESIACVDDIIGHDYPIDAWWIDSWFWDCKGRGNGPGGYLDFVGDTVSYPDRHAMWKYLEDRGIKGGFWIWNCILKEGNEEAFDAFDSRGYFSKVYENDNPWHNKSTTLNMYETRDGHPATPCGDIDFNNPEAVRYFKERMKPFFDEGADFLKLDRTSDLATIKAMYEASQELGLESKGRGFLLAHTGGTDNPESRRYPGRWSDDTRSDWAMDAPTREFDSWVPKTCLKENIEKFTDPRRHSSNIPFMAQDMGGYVVGNGTKVPEEQLYIRWMEFAFFCPMVEVFSIESNVTQNFAFNYSPLSDRLFHDYSHLRMELFPYIYSSAYQVRQDGKLMVRCTEDSVYDYHFGDEFLVAPVYVKDAVTREVSFPDGTWVDYWTGECHEGGSKAVVDAPLERIPLFVKAGSIVPARAYAPSVEAGSNDSLTLHLYPGADGSFTLYEDDGTAAYLGGEFSSTLICLKDEGDRLVVDIAPRKGSYKGEPSRRKVSFEVHSSAGYSIPKAPVTFRCDKGCRVEIPLCQ